MATIFENGTNSNGAFSTSPTGGAGAGNISPNENGGEGSGRDRSGMMVNKRLTAASLGNRNTNRYSVTALYSMAAEQDIEVEDDLARGE